MGVTLSEIKAFIKFSIFIKNILTKLPTFWMLKSLFGPFIGRKRFYISAPPLFMLNALTVTPSSHIGKGVPCLVVSGLIFRG